MEKKIDNIAHMTGKIENKTVETPICPNLECLYFEMEDKYHVFQIGLKTLLECLMFAEKQEQIPKLPITWYVDVCSRYDIPIETDEGVIDI